MSHSKLKFKMLASGYSPFSFPWTKLEEVDLRTFCTSETKRLPLFIGTQFGLSPVFNFSLLEGQRIAILHKSALSGHQALIGIYNIVDGARKKTNEIALEPPFWNEKEVVYFHFNHPEIKPHRRNRIPRRYRSKLNSYLGIDYIQNHKGSLSDVYHSAIRNAYLSFVEYCYENREATWQDYLGHKNFWLEVFELLEICRKSVCPRIKNLPLRLEYALKLYGNIQNPYHIRSKKYFRIPETPDILVLSDFALSIYYNNYININTVEAFEIQEAIIEEFRAREYYIVNEYQLNGHANPIAIWELRTGEKKLAVNKYLPYRQDKDILKFESGRAIGQVTYEAIYGGFNKKSDVEIVNSYNRQVGINYWGGGRAAGIRALVAQLRKRRIEMSAIQTENGISLANCVVLEQKKLLKLNELSKPRISHLLSYYLKILFPSLANKGLKVLMYNEKCIRFYVTEAEKCFEIPTNDLIQKKGSLTYLPGIRIRVVPITNN